MMANESANVAPGRGESFFATIVIPTYNPGPVLRECITAACALAVPNDQTIELIVVDNNSSPEHHENIKALLRETKSPRVVPRLLIETAQGAGHARARGVHEARAEFVGCLDDDNVAHPDWLSSGVQALRANARAAVFTGLLLPPPWAPTSESFKKCHEPFAIRTEPTDRCFRYATQRGQAPPSAGCVVRRSAIIETLLASPPLLQGLSKTFPLTAEDTELFLRLGHRGWEVWHSPDLVCTHAIAPSRFTAVAVRRLMRGIGLAHSPLRLIRTRSVANWVLTMPALFLRDAIRLYRQVVRKVGRGSDPYAAAPAWRQFYAVQSPIRGNYHLVKSRVLGRHVFLRASGWREVQIEK